MTRTKKESNRLVNVAYHEAGHAIVANYLHIALRKMKAVSIVERTDSYGRFPISRAGLGSPLKWLGTGRERGHAENYVLVCFAGVEAQRRHDPRSVRSVDGSADRGRASNVMEPFVASGEERRAWMKLLEIRARRIIADRWPYIEALAKELLKRREMDRDDVITVIESVNDARFAAGKAARKVEVVNTTSTDLPLNPVQ